MDKTQVHNKLFDKFRAFDREQTIFAIEQSFKMENNQLKAYILDYIFIYLMGRYTKEIAYADFTFNSDLKTLV